MKKNNNSVLLTEAGFLKLKEELKHLIDVERPSVIQEIKDARELGDLSENAEYDAARDRQAKIESRIAEIESILPKVEVIKATSSDQVTIGSTVTIQRVKEKKELVYTIVGSIDADPISNRISNESPLAISILGKEIGDVIEVDAPVKYKVKIIKITH